MMFATLIGSFTNKPFSECSCMGLIKTLYDELNIPFPEEFKGLTVENYMDLFRKDSEQALSIMTELFSQLGKPVPLDRLKLKDLIIVQQKDGVRFPAVYVGKDKAVASFLRKGVQVFPLNVLNKPILARRLV